jgi:outer membrane protein assembly factor BamB
MKKIIYLSFLGLFFMSCKDKENPIPEPPVVIAPIDTVCVDCKNCKEGDGISGPLCLWKSPIIDNKELSGNDKPFFYKDFVIISRSQTGITKEPILFFHKGTGKRLGIWEDYAEGAPASLSAQSFYAYDNTLMVGTGTRVYAIDLATFKTKWMTKSHNWGDWEVGGIANSTFHFTMSEDQKTIYLEKGFTNSKKIETIYQETVPDNIKVGIKSYYTYVEQKDTMLLFWMSKYNYTTYVLDWYLTSYNVTQKKQIYQEQLNEFDGDTGLPDDPMVKDGKMYISVGHGLYCLDIKTGKDLWRKELPSHHTSEAIIGEDNRVYVTSQANPEAVFYCFDSSTGAELWNVKTDNSLQNMVYHNGIVYSCASGTTKINAIDTKQQKVLWKYKCSEGNTGKSIYFLPYLNIDKPNNKLYIGSNTTLYCLKTL